MTVSDERFPTRSPDEPPDGGPGILGRTLIAIFGIYLILRFAVPWLSVLVGASPAPAPVPRFAMGIYLFCAILGALVYVSSEEGRWKAFLTPIVHALAVQPGDLRGARLLPLSIFPLLVGWIAWSHVMPASESPPEGRVQHPGLPDRYAGIENPFGDLTGQERAEVVREGTLLYQKNCRPCHGTMATGDGPLARGLRLRPVDFTDPGTIATVVEQYPFWRIREGGIGLPGIATPWHSAMPAWKDELGADDIWRIIMAEHDIAGTEPRRPERSDR